MVEKQILNTQSEKKKNNLINKKHTTGHTNYNNNMSLPIAINFDSNLAALLTTVTIGKSNYVPK